MSEVYPLCIFLKNGVPIDSFHCMPHIEKSSENIKDETNDIGPITLSPFLLHMPFSTCSSDSFISLIFMNSSKSSRCFIKVEMEGAKINDSEQLKNISAILNDSPFAIFCKRREHRSQYPTLLSTNELEEQQSIMDLGSNISNCVVKNALLKVKKHQGDCILEGLPSMSFSFEDENDNLKGDHEEDLQFENENCSHEGFPANYTFKGSGNPFSIRVPSYCASFIFGKKDTDFTKSCSLDASKHIFLLPPSSCMQLDILFHPSAFSQMPVSHFPMLLTSLISVNLLSCSSKEIDNFKKNISYDDFKKDEGVIYQLIPLTGIVGSDNISAPSCVSQLLDFSVIPSSILQSTPFTPLSNSCKTNERSPSKSFLKQSQDPSSTPFSAESIGIHDFLGANETQTSLQATNNTFFEPSISFSSPEHANNPTTEQQMANKAAQLSDQCIPFRNSETITTSQHSNKKDTIPSNTQASSKYVAIQQLIPVMNNSEYKLSASIECTSSVTAITPISSSLIPDDRTDKNDEDPNSRLMSQGSNNLFNETIDKGTSQKENCISEYCQTIPLFNHESEIQIIPSYIQQIFYPSLFKQHFKSSTLSRLSSSFGSSTNFSSISTSFSTTSQPTPFHRELGASNTSFRQMSPFHRNNTFQTSLSTVVPSSLSLEPADSASITMTLSSPSSSLFLSALHSHMCITTAMRAIFPELPLEIIPLNLSECSAVCHVEGHININAVNTAKVASPIMDSDGANQQTDKQKNNERREQHKDNFNERIICKFRFSAAFDPSQLADVEQQEDLSIQIEGEEPNLLENTTNEAGTEISSSKGSHDNEDILPFEQHFGKEGSEKRRKDKTFVSPDAENFQIKQKQVDEKEYDTSHSLDTPIHQHFESDEKIHNHLAQTEKENYSKDDSPQKELLSEFDDVKEESESHESKNENSSEEEKQEEKDYIDSEQDHSKKNKKTNRETPTLSDLHSMLTDLLRLTLSKPDRKIEAKCETDDLDEKEKGKSNEKREKSVTDHVAGKQNEKDSKQIEEDDNELLLHQHTASSSRASASSPLPSIVPPSSLPSFHLQTPFISNTISVSSSKNSENSYKFPRTVSPSQNGGISTEMSFPVNEFPSMFSVNPHLDAGKVSDSEPLFHIPSPSPPISCNFSNSLPPPPPPPHKLITVGSSQSLHSTSTAFAATLPTSFETYPSDATSSTVPALHQYSLHHNPSTGQSILPLPRHSQSPPRHQPSTTIFQTPSFISSNSETKTNTFTSTMPSLPSISLPPSPTQSFITSGVSFPFLPSSSSTLSSSSPSSAMRMPSYSNNLSTSGKSRNPLSPARQPPVARSSLASARNKLFSNQKERDYQNKSKKSEMISTTIPIEDANEDHKGTSIEFGKPERKDKISRTDAEGSDCGRNNVTFSVSSQTSPIRDSERLTNPKIHMDSYHQDAFARENQNEEIGKHLQSGSSSCSPNTVSFMKKCDSNLPKPNSSSDKDNTRQDFVEEKILKEVMKMKKALDAIEKRSKNKKTERHDSFASERKISPDRKYEKKEMERMRDKLIKLIEEFKRSTDSFAETQRNKSTSFSPPPRSTVLEYDSPSSYRQSSFHSNSEARTKDNRRRVFSDSAKRKFAHKKHESAPHQMESYIDQIFSTKDFERKHLKHKELPRHRSHHSHRNHQHLSKSIAKTSSASSIEPKVTVQKSHIQTQTDDLSPQNYRPISQSISLPQNSLLQMSGTVNQNATPTSTNSQIFPNATVSIATTPLVPTTTPTQITTNPITPQDIPPIVITLPRSHSHRHYHHHRHHRRHSPSSISSINKTRSRSQRRGTSTKQLDSKSKSPSIESKRMESFNKGQGMLDEHSNISKTSHSSLSHSKRSSCNPHIHHSPGKQSVKVVLDPEKIHSLANQTAFLKSSSSSLPHSNTAKPHGKIADSSNDMHQTSHSHSHSQVHSNTQPESNSPRSILGRLLNTHSKKKNTSSCESFTPSYAKNESVSFRSSPLLNRSSSPVLLHSIRSPSAGSSPTSSKGQRSELLYSPPRQQPMPIASHPATDSQFSSPISDGKTEPDAVAREATEKTRRSSHSPSSSRPSSSFSDPARNKQMDSPSSPHQSSKSHKSHKLPRTVIPSRRPTSASSFSFSLCSPLSSSTFTQTCEEPSLQFSSTPLKDNYLGTSKKQQLLNLSKKHIIFEVTPAKSTLEKSLWFENQTKEPLFWRITANGDAVSINEGEKAQQRNDEVAQSSSLYSNETSKVNIQKVCDEQPRQTEIKPVFDIKTAESGWIAPFAQEQILFLFNPTKMQNKGSWKQSFIMNVFKSATKQIQQHEETFDKRESNERHKIKVFGFYSQNEKKRRMDESQFSIKQKTSNTSLPFSPQQTSQQSNSNQMAYGSKQKPSSALGHEFAYASESKKPQLFSSELHLTQTPPPQQPLTQPPLPLLTYSGSKESENTAFGLHSIDKSRNQQYPEAGHSISFSFKSSPLDQKHSSLGTTSHEHSRLLSSERAIIRNREKNSFSSENTPTSTSSNCLTKHPTINSLISPHRSEPPRRSISPCSSYLKEKENLLFSE